MENNKERIFLPVSCHLKQLWVTYCFGHFTKTQMISAASITCPVLMVVQVISSAVLGYDCPNNKALDERLACMK